MTYGIVQLLQTVLISMVFPNSLLTLDVCCEPTTEWYIYIILQSIKFLPCDVLYGKGIGHATVVALNSITVVQC